MSLEEYTWIDTLSPYLSSSNEDEAVITFFRRRVVLIVRKELGAVPIHWLDVGTGPGTKTIGFAEALADEVGGERIDLVMLDPEFAASKHSSRRLVDAIGRVVGSAQTVTVTLERYREEVNGRRICSNLLTAIHLLYSPSLVGPLVDYAEAAAMSSRIVVFAVAESANSDFFKIRANLLADEVAVPHTTLDDFVTALSSVGFRIDEYEIGGQECRIDRSRLMGDDGYWLFPFIAGCRKSEFLHSARTLRERVCQTTREFVSLLSIPVLKVPDKAVIAVSTADWRRNE